MITRLKYLPGKWVEMPANCVKKGLPWCFHPSQPVQLQVAVLLIIVSGQNFSLNGGHRQLHEGLHDCLHVKRMNPIPSLVY